jgi:hypothetical protein
MATVLYDFNGMTSEEIEVKKGKQFSHRVKSEDLY